MPYHPAVRSLSRIAAGLGLVVGLALLGAPETSAQSLDRTVESAEIVGDKVVLTVDGGVSASNVSVIEKEDPYRLMVDIYDISPGAAPPVLPGSGGLVERVLITEVENDLGGIDARATIYTTGPVEHQLSVKDGQISLALTPGTNGFGASDAVASGSSDPQPSASSSGSSSGSTRAGADDGTGKLDSDDNRGVQAHAVSGPSEIAGRSLASLDFENLDDTSRVVIGTTTASDYTTSQPDQNMVVVDIPGVAVPQSLTRVLDTTEFISPVRMVRAYRTRSGARVAITLQRSVEWRVVAGPDNLIYVDFDVPDSMIQDRATAQQGFSEVAPSASEQGGLESYGVQEKLIGESGQTYNPQSTFGSGEGASAPGTLNLGGASFNTPGSTSSQQWTGRRINLDLVEADIHSVFRLISHVSRLNIVSSDNVSGTVTVRLENVPWDQALAAILQAKGLGAQQFGNIIRVAPLEVLNAEQQQAVEAQRHIEELTPLSLLVIPLNYSTAADISGQVQKMISTRGSVDFDERTNQLIIKETEERLAQIRELVRQLDRQTPQVLIEARVVEASSNFTRSLGVQWGGELDLSAATGAGTGLFFPNEIGVSGGNTQIPTGVTDQFYSPGADNLAVSLPADASFGSLALSLGSLTGLIDLEARLTAMESEGWGEVISAPRVTTLDNRAASITQGARIPYLSTSAGGTQVQFVQAALTLDVTPHITSDKKIFMEVSIRNNRPDFSNLVQGQPAIQIKEAETELLIADGDTTVIGGVFASEENLSYNRIPFFSRIPLIGWAFRSRSQSTLRNEMLVFLTPRIVTREVPD